MGNRGVDLSSALGMNLGNSSLFPQILCNWQLDHIRMLFVFLNKVLAIGI